MQDYYETLQVHPKADSEAIDAAYARLAALYDPARLEGSADDLVALARSKRAAIEQAYAVLHDPARRAAYDRQHVTRPPDAPGGVPPDEEVLDYRPLPPANRQERPRGFNAQPLAGAQRSVVRRGRAVQGRNMPRWLTPSVIVGGLTAAVVMVGLFLSDGGRPPAAVVEGTPNVGQIPLGTPPPAEDIIASYAAEVSNREAAAQADPQNPAAWIALGNAYYDSIQVVRELRPNNPEEYQALIVRWQQAAGAYQRALDLQPENHVVRADRGVALCYYGAGVADQSSVAQGLAEVQAAARAQPEHARIRVNLGICLVSSDPPEVQAALQSWRAVLATADPQSQEAFLAQRLIDQYAP